MRRAALVGALLLSFLAGVWWLLRETDPDNATNAEANSAIPKTDAAADEIARKIQDRLAAGAEAQLEKPRGTLEIRGRVIGPEGPVRGATVTATLAEKDESLS